MDYAPRPHKLHSQSLKVPVIGQSLKLTSYEKSLQYTAFFRLYHIQSIDSEHVLPQVKIVFYFHVYKNAQNIGK